MSIANYHIFDVIISKPDPKDPNKTFIVQQPGPNGLFSGGLAMNMTIGVDSVTSESLQAQSAQIISPVNVRALFDTGCTVTSIDKSIISQLNLKTIGFSSISTANGCADTSHHLVSLAFPGTTLKGRLVHKVMSVDLTGQPFQALIGRDLMCTWSIHYNGPGGFVSIAD